MVFMATKLAEEVGYLPLAVSLVAAHLRASGDGAEQYLRRYKQDIRHRIEMRVEETGSHTASLQAILQTTCEVMEVAQPGIERLLAMLGILTLHYRDIPKSPLHQLREPGTWHERLWPVDVYGESGIQIARMLRRLQDHGILAVNLAGSGYDCHKLVHDWLRDGLKERKRKESTRGQPTGGGEGESYRDFRVDEIAEASRKMLTEWIIANHSWEWPSRLNATRHLSHFYHLATIVAPLDLSDDLFDWLCRDGPIGNVIEDVPREIMPASMPTGGTRASGVKGGGRASISLQR